MAQKDTVSDKFLKIWERLGKHWEPYFEKARLDLRNLDSDNLHERLTSHIDINFNVEGLEELSTDCCRGIEPGDPARSLFYHVMASPYVNPPWICEADRHNYPTIEDLEIIENFVYVSANMTLDKLRDQAAGHELAIVTFAYEYATAADTVHKCHADLCFSRTGISRVGNREPLYEYKARGFFPYSRALNSVHAIPARFGAFLAVQRDGNDKTFGPMHFTHDDRKRKFWVPIHKLFNGTECIKGLDLQLRFDFKHVNEKIRKVHIALQSTGMDTGWNAWQMQKKPFVITAELATFCPDTGLMVPVVHDPLIEPAKTVDGRMVGFPVPQVPKLEVASLWLQNDLEGRQWPEFVHIKHKIVEDLTGKQDLVYLPDVCKGDIKDVLQEGGFVAANFVDWTADGFVRAHCPALSDALDHPRHPSQCLSAYSILAQPDFFPLVKQQDLAEWWKTSPLKDTIWRANDVDDDIVPTPLSDNRSPANITLTGADFDSCDDTMTAIIGTDRHPERKCQINKVAPKRESTLSYRASNLFEPGWDTSDAFGRDKKSPQGTLFLTNYGLGSPFAEDTLICSAMGSYWPAAVPDIARFFPPVSYPSTTPLTDLDGEWPAVTQPVRVGETMQYLAFDYADFVKAIRDGQFQYGRFAILSLDEYILRTEITARFYRYLHTIDPLTHPTKGEERARLVITSFRRVNQDDLNHLNNWTDNPDESFFIEWGTKGEQTTIDPRTISVHVGPPHVVIVGPSLVAYVETAKWTIKPLP
jgi:hypothetical protein